MPGAKQPEIHDGVAILPFDRDDQLIDRAARGGTGVVDVYRVDDTRVVLGRGSRIDRELNWDACKRANLPIYRRPGGGCSVVLDPGNVIVSTAVPLAGFGNNTRYMRALTQWLLDALAITGIEHLARAGISDLVQLQNGVERKISGSCIYRGRDVLYFSATLLVSPDVAAIDRYLAHPPREPDYRQGRGHSAFVAPLVSEFADAEALESALRATLSPLALSAL